MSRTWILLVTLVATVACGGETPTTPTRDWIELNSISPTANTTLTPGERVTFTATVTCTVATANGGMVGMLVMDQGNRNLGSTPQPSMDLPKGDKTVTLTDTITVPASGSTITVAIPLWVDGSNTTRAMKLTTYPVK